MPSEIAQVVPANISVKKQVVQVGSPAFPESLRVELIIESTGQKWTKRRWRRWKISPETQLRKIAGYIHPEEFERMIFEWQDEWETFEIWRDAMKRQTEKRIERQLKVEKDGGTWEWKPDPEEPEWHEFPEEEGG